MSHPKYITLHFGSDGSMLAEQGAGVPMFFVAGSDVAHVFAKDPEMGPHILSQVGEVAMLLSMVHDIIDLRSIDVLHRSIPAGTPAFWVKLRTGLVAAYIDNPKAIHLTSWLAEQKINVVVTPRNARMTTLDGLPHAHEVMHVVETWNDRIVASKSAQLPDIDAAWQRTVDTYHDMKRPGS